MHVLVVSRSPMMAMSLRSDYDVTDLRPPAFAEWLEEREDVDALVLDLADPRAAYQAVVDLRAQARMAPALLVSSEAEGWDDLAVRDLPAARVLPLPVTRPGLMAALADLLRSDSPGRGRAGGSMSPAVARDLEVEPLPVPVDPTPQPAQSPYPEPALEPPAEVAVPPVAEPVAAPVAEPVAAVDAPPATAEPVAPEPVAPEPVAAEPVVPEPMAAEPVVPEPTTAEPAVAAEPAGSVPGAVEYAASAAPAAIDVAPPLSAVLPPPATPAPPTAAAPAPAADWTPSRRRDKADDPQSLVRRLREHLHELATVSEVADVVVADALERVHAEAGALLVPDGDRWRVSGGVGLRPLEHRLELAETSWLVREVAHGGAGVLVEDTDIARNPLHGAPLASWKHLLVAPIPLVEGLLILAHSDRPFSESDLGALAGLGNEAGPLLQTAVETRALARSLSYFTELDEI